MNEQAKVFLSKIQDKIKNGEFDYAVSIFVSRELIYSSIKSRVIQKSENGGSPLLTDTQINDAIEDTKEIGNITASIFYKLGLIKKSNEGLIVPEKFQKFLKSL